MYLRTCLKSLAHCTPSLWLIFPHSALIFPSLPPASVVKIALIDEKSSHKSGAPEDFKQVLIWAIFVI